MSSRGTKSRKPEVGFGVVGRNTLTSSSAPARSRMSPEVSVETKATAQSPLRGYSIRQAFWNELLVWLKMVSTTLFPYTTLFRSRKSVV